MFYWKGNVTQPISYERWAELIMTTLNHLIERYGREEVITWPVEVWNEPNVSFWAGTMEEYFILYDYSAEAVKKVDSRIQVGGPAICGVETEKWLRSFFEHCIERITRRWILSPAIVILPINQLSEDIIYIIL